MLFREPGPSVPVSAGDVVVSSQIIEVEAFRAVDRARLQGDLDDAETAIKRQELTELLSMMDLVPTDALIIASARSPFAVNVRALDAIHVATAEVLTHALDREVLEFWTHDIRQGTAALSRGLAVRGL
jgi:uncharacterized protein YcaQ